MKYIIFERPDGLPSLVIFDELTSHSDMKNKIDFPVTGAGMVNFVIDKNGEVVPSVIHKSVSLKIEFSKEKSLEDAETINRVMNFRSWLCNKNPYLGNSSNQ